MKFNLREIWQNSNKKNVAIIVSILIFVILCVIGGLEYYHYAKLKAEKEKIRVKYEQYSRMSMDQPAPTKKPSEYTVGMDYNRAMKSKKPVLVLFYADWCHFCVKFMPKFQQLASVYEKDIDFAKVNVEDKKYEELVRTIGITGYPTVFIIDPKYDNKVLLSNASLGSVEAVSIELDRYIRIRKILDSKK